MTGTEVSIDLDNGQLEDLYEGNVVQLLNS